MSELVEKIKKEIKSANKIITILIPARKDKLEQVQVMIGHLELRTQLNVMRVRHNGILLGVLTQEEKEQVENSLKERSTKKYQYGKE